TLFGRIQTRIILLATIGSLVTLIVVPLIGGTLKVGFTVLAWVAIFGIGWELLYHFLMQFRWEKDWPNLYALFTFIPEGLLLWSVLDKLPGISAKPSAGAFWTQFILVWLCVWLVANGPMRVPFIRWRFRGGRLI